MRPYEVFARLHSKNGETAQVLMLGPNYMLGREINNSYIFKVGNLLCTGIYNVFANAYYVDDKYGIVQKNDENYNKYKKYIGE